MESKIDWDKIKVVIFDVDGTLYEQAKLRKKMLSSLLSFYMLRPWKVGEISIIQTFRTEREKRAGTICADLENAQYSWCTKNGRYPLPEIKKIIDKWIFEYPLQHLPGCTYPGTKEFFEALRERGITVAIYSDYKANDKLKAMGLKADLIVSSTDPEIDRLKPDPKGLLYIAEKLGLSPEECLFIGDRQELDGECAIRAKMPYLIIEKKPLKAFDFYKTLKSQFLDLESTCPP